MRFIHRVTLVGVLLISLAIVCPQQLSRVKSTIGKSDMDEHQRQFLEKVQAHVRDNFQGDYRKAFEHYDRNKDEAISSAELKEFLSAIGITGPLALRLWASGIQEKMDSNRDALISWDEFQSVFVR